MSLLLALRGLATRWCGLISLTLLNPAAADARPPSSDPAMQTRLNQAVEETCSRFKATSLKPEQLAVTFVDITKPDAPRQASFRGDVPTYPASVIKLFYLVAAHRWLEDGRLQDTAELRRALRDMIVESSNEATHYVLDLLTDTTSGPELGQPALELWQHQRNAVNRYFASLGYTNINANKKPWCEGPYGRETQAIRSFEPKRNLLTTDATARLLVEVASGSAVTPNRSQQMLELLRRNREDPNDKDPDSQARFAGPGLPAGAKLWSKAGWTSETRHDALYTELPYGGRFVLVVFSVEHAHEREILPDLTRRLLGRP